MFKPGRRSVRSGIALLCLFTWVLTSVTAEAGLYPQRLRKKWYYEIMGGTTMMFRTSPYFAGGPTVTLPGAAAMLSLFYDPTKRKSEVRFQFGGEVRFNLATSGNTYMTAAPYFVMRQEFSGLVFMGLGISPAVFGGTGTLGYTAGTLGALGELGTMWYVIPWFAMGIMGSAQVIYSGGQFSPMPIADVMGFWRFHFGGGYVFRDGPYEWRR